MPPPDDRAADDEKTTSSKGDWVAILGFFVVLVVFLYLGGASERGITKLIERDALKKGEIPSEWSFIFYHILNSMILGIPGLLANIFVADPFAGTAVMRPSHVGPNLAHEMHFTSPTNAPSAAA